METRSELEALQEQLRAEYEAEFEQLVYNVSHDVRQPIVPILGFASILMEDLRPLMNAEQLRFMRRILSSVQRMQRILDRLLLLSRAARTPRPDVSSDLEPVLDEVMTTHSDIIRSAGATIHRAASLPAQLRGAAADLKMLFAELLTNAVVYREEGKAPSVEVGTGPDLPDEPDRLHVWVRDDGLGIDPRYLSEIFQPCKRFGVPHPDRAGLGLAIARRVVKRYGGKIWVDSELGKGSTFHFTWPR